LKGQKTKRKIWNERQKSIDAAMKMKRDQSNEMSTQAQTPDAEQKKNEERMKA